MIRQSDEASIPPWEHFGALDRASDTLDFSDLAAPAAPDLSDLTAPAPPPDQAVSPPAPRGDGIIEGLTDPQQYAEGVKGVLPGAVQFGGTILRGVDVAGARGQRNIYDFNQRQLEITNRIDRGETVPEAEDATGYQHMDAAQRAAVRAELQRPFNPTPVQDRPFYRAGDAVQEYAKGIWPAAPGYEQSAGRQLGEGLGSMVAGLPAAFLGTLPALGVFGAAGMGEATQRAVEFDKKERAEGRSGLTQEQITLAGLLGVGPGATDIVPIEIMLGRLPLPIPTALQRPLAQAIARIGGQAFVEGVQEGGQQFLQNLIAQQVYNSDQALGQDVLGNVGIGAGVGGIAQTGKEAAGGLMREGRRGGSAGQQPQPDAQQGALPPPAQAPATPPADAPDAGSGPIPPPLPLSTPPAEPADAALLRGQGWSDEDIADMDPAQREEELGNARRQDVAPQPPALAPDQPSAEPIGDLVAQARDLADPANPRQALWLPAARLDALDLRQARRLRRELGPANITPEHVVDNFDGQGGFLIAGSSALRDWALQERDQGTSTQQIVDAFTGAGGGGPTGVTRAGQVRQPPTQRTQQGPFADLVSQARDLADPATSRRALLAPAARLEAVNLDPQARAAWVAALGSAGHVAVVDNFDGQGGVLIARDEATAHASIRARDQGRSVQEIIGNLAGSERRAKPPPLPSAQPIATTARQKTGPSLFARLGANLEAASKRQPLPYHAERGRLVERGFIQPSRNGVSARLLRAGRAALNGFRERATNPDTGTPMAAASHAADVAQAWYQAEVLLSLGETVVVPADVILGMHTALQPYLGIVPRGTKVGILVAMEPKNSYLDLHPESGRSSVGAHFMDRDGHIFPVNIEWGALTSTRAFAMPDGRSIGFVRLRLPDQSVPAFGGQRGIGQIRFGELVHELVHALRGRGLLGHRGRGGSPVWDRLLAHAKSLKVMDGTLGDYLRMIGDPPKSKATDQITLRRAYELRYENTTDRDRADRLDEETVCHMAELYVHGKISAKDVAPVKDLLDALVTGRLSGQLGVPPLHGRDYPLPADVGGGGRIAPVSEPARPPRSAKQTNKKPGRSRVFRWS